MQKPKQHIRLFEGHTLYRGAFLQLLSGRAGVGTVGHDFIGGPSIRRQRLPVRIN